MQIDSKVKVIKFGGSSLADATQFKKVAEIIKADPCRRLLVPSAPGKRFKEDKKVTDMLYACYDAAVSGINIDGIFNEIKERYQEIANSLGIDCGLDLEFENIKNAIKHKAGRDYAASRGEYLNAKILSVYLGFDFIDAADVIFFSDNGDFDAEKTNSILSGVLSLHERAVIPGFYGSMPNGTIKTFSRGGSDITGSIVARAANAVLYENWTDVSGFLMADPGIVENPKPIEYITYRELRELAYMGATVLHEDAIFPVRKAQIPINIRNTNRPLDKGTMIIPDHTYVEDMSNDIITGIAGKKGFSVITIEKAMMNSELGFGRRILEVFENEGISFEHLPSGIDTMSVVVNTNSLEEKRDRIVMNITKSVNPDNIFVEDHLALLAVVGHGMVNTTGTAARILKSVSEQGINIRMIDQGSSEYNVILGVDSENLEKAMNAVYSEFIR